MMEIDAFPARLRGGFTVQIFLLRHSCRINVMKRISLYIAICMAGLLMAGAAEAGEPRLVASHGAWSAYVFTEDGNKVCYMASQPQKAGGIIPRSEEARVG